MGLATAKVPVIVASSMICLAAGVAAGIVVTGLYGEKWFPKKEAAQEAPPPDPNAPRGMMVGMGPGVPDGNQRVARGPGGAPMGGPGGGGNRGPNAKMQLANLVTKLDVLTKQPLTIALTPEQKKKVEEELTGLDAKEEISDEEAKKKVEALQELLKDQKKTLEEVGYRWDQGQGGGGGNRGGGGGGQAPKNPFKEGTPHDHLKDLQKRVESPKT